MKKVKLLVVLFLLVPCVLVAKFNGWAPAIEISGGYYGAKALTPTIYHNNLLRTQATFNVALDAISLTFEPININVGINSHLTTPSLTYNGTKLKGFLALGLRANVSYNLSSSYALGLGAEMGYGFYGNDIKFGYISAFVHNEYTFIVSPYWNVSAIAPLELSYKKDIFAVSLSLGLRFRFKGNWILEEDVL